MFKYLRTILVLNKIKMLGTNIANSKDFEEYAMACLSFNTYKSKVARLVVFDKVDRKAVLSLIKTYESCFKNNT